MDGRRDREKPQTSKYLKRNRTLDSGGNTSQKTVLTLSTLRSWGFCSFSVSLRSPQSGSSLSFFHLAYFFFFNMARKSIPLASVRRGCDGEVNKGRLWKCDRWKKGERRRTGGMCWMIKRCEARMMERKDKNRKNEGRRWFGYEVKIEKEIGMRR